MVKMITMMMTEERIKATEKVKREVFSLVRLVQVGCHYDHDEEEENDYDDEDNDDEDDNDDHSGDEQVPADGEEQETKRGKGERAELSQLDKVNSYQTGLLSW